MKTFPMYYKIEDLRQLIQSMSGAEKRYFSLFSETFLPPGETPLYLQLFRSLVKPVSELPAFDKEVSIQAHTTAKKRLFRNILRCMSIYHHEKSPDIIIQNQLSQIEILYHLNLPSQGLLPLEKAYRLCVSHEKFGLLLQVLEWERRLNIVLDIPTRSNMAIQKEERDVLSKLQQIMGLENIYSNARELKKQYGYVKGELKENLEHETILAADMPTLDKCLSKKASYYYNFIHALHYWMTFDHQNAYRYSKELLIPEYQVVLPDDYIDGILEHVTSCVCLGLFDAALNGLAIAEAYIAENKLDLSHNFRLKIFYYQVSYQIIIYNYTGDRGQLKQTVTEAEAKMKQYDRHLSTEAKQVIKGNLMNAYLGLGNIKKVDEIWNSLFRKKSKSVRRDIYDDLYFFRLFSVLQNKSYILLVPVATSAFRYYRRFSDHDSHFSIEIEVSALLMKDHDFTKTETKREVLEQIGRMLATYIDGLKGVHHFQEHYTFYGIWAKSLINENSFNEEAGKWYMDFRKGKEEKPGPEGC